MSRATHRISRAWANVLFASNQSFTDFTQRVTLMLNFTKRWIQSLNSIELQVHRLSWNDNLPDTWTFWIAAESKVRRPLRRRDPLSAAASVGNSVNVRSRLTRPNKNRINSESVSSSSSSGGGGSSSEVTSTTSTTVKPARSRRPSPLRKSSTSGILSSKNSFSSNSGSSSSGRNGTDKDYKIVCYYTNWSQYRPKIGKYLPENAEADLCTHIIFAFGWLKKGKLSSLESNDESVDGKVGLYERINQMKQANPKLKTLLAIGKFSSSIDNWPKWRTFTLFFFLGNELMEGKSLRNSRGHPEIPL